MNKLSRQKRSQLILAIVMTLAVVSAAKEARGGGERPVPARPVEG